eukprot:904135_1
MALTRGIESNCKQAHIETHPTISPKECYEWFESTEYYSYSYFEKNFAKIKRGIQPERALKVQNGRKSTTSYEGNKDLAKSIGTEIFTKYKTLDDVLHFLNILSYHAIILRYV